MFKKWFAACMAVTMSAVLTACRKDVSSSIKNTEVSELSAAESSAETSELDFTLPEGILGDASPLVPGTVNVDKMAVPESEGLQFTKQLKLGWNLGNTFDASDCESYTSNDLDYESAWCGSVTTTRDIAAIKAAGFQTIRIPVSWHNHVDAQYHINEAWLNRVKEVVSWCRTCDLYVILNIHHDNAEDFLYPDSVHLEQSKAYVTAIWEQLAAAFADEDEHLIFEAMNEPRLVGTAYEWSLDTGNAVCQDAVSCINTLNQVFVDTVRAAGGNNAVRYLMCPGYAASVEGCLNDGFALPQDPANRVIVSVHAYTPYNFALNKTGTDEFDCENSADVGSITSFMDNLYGKFICNQIPVVIGEFGALNKDNLEQRVEFAAVYTAAAHRRGIPCCWWDNNAFSGSGENFGLLYRKTAKFLYPEIVQAMNQYAQ